MSSHTLSFGSVQRWAAAGFACLLLLAPAASASARANAPTCQASRKGKSASSKRSRKADKSKSATQETSTNTDSSASSSSTDDIDDLGGLDDIAPKRTEQPAVKPEPPAPVKPRREEPVAETVSDDDSSSAAEASVAESDAEAPAAGEGADAEPAPENASEAASGPSVVIDAYAGFGIATRSLHMPATMMKGVLSIAPGVTPAAEVGLRVTSHPNAPFSYYVHLVYQSALGFSVTEHPPLALPKEVRARSERVALEFAPRWHLASSNLDIAIPLGATVRTLWAEVHTSQTPSFSLVGPHVRFEAVLSVTDMLSLRLSPELHYIIMIDQDLLNAGVGSSGPAIGGDVGADVRLSQMWSLGLNYRESHALLPASRGDIAFRDVERYLTLRATGSF